MICEFPGCSSSTPEGKKMCFRHNSHFGNVTIKAVDKAVTRAEDEKQYKVVRKQFLKDHPICQVKGCNKPAAEVHHKKGRIGTLLTDVKSFLGTCRSHHKQIEQNPLWAKQEGYSLSRLSK